VDSDAGGFFDDAGAELEQPQPDQSRIVPVAETIGQEVGQTQAAFRLAQQHQAAVRGDQATVEGCRHLLATDGWKIEGKKAIVCHGGCGLKDVGTTNFYTISTNYTTLANPESDPA
jgi:hypothetical protein